MPRKAREYIDQDETIYHIVCRGNNQKRVFLRPRDYKKLLSIIRQIKRELPFYFYSYNLLPNHFHLLIETRDISLSKIMGRINFLYAIYFNHRYHRSGHVFQDRFYSSIIDREKYFWAVGRYIDLNAVRAGIVNAPEDYRWSSFSIYSQKVYNDDLIDRDKFLSYTGVADSEQARQEYVDFVRSSIDAQEDKRPKFIKSQTMI